MEELEMIIAIYSVSADVGIEIINIIYDIDDKIQFTWNVCGIRKKQRCSKIRYDADGKAYFNSCGRKIYLDECIRVDR